MGDNFKEYLLKEYEEVAGAHFKTLESVSAFFKNYIVIMSLPAAIFSFFFQKEDYSRFNNLLISIAFIAFSAIGIGVCLYIINLRLDAILYARTVNGIRRFFYNSSQTDNLEKLKIRTLPVSTLVPSYHDVSNFWPVLSVFSIFNGMYAAIGTVFFASYYLGITNKEAIHDLIVGIYATPLSVLILMIGAHFLFFKELAWYREFGYLKSNIIGIDIDGVLNKHRDHFCTIVTERGVSLLPEGITHMPVHEMENLQPRISREDEIYVFNSPKYWLEMPPTEDGAENIKKLLNALGFKIYIFTHRPWPDTTYLNESDAEKTHRAWVCEMLRFIQAIPLFRMKVLQLLLFNVYYRHFKTKMIDQATILWLKKHNYKYNKLIIEKGNENLLSKRTKLRNRLVFSGKKRIKFFVEDDLEKAIKLSYICDIVYLIDHPYNHDDGNLPSNIIRVVGWNDIFRQIRKAV